MKKLMDLARFFSRAHDRGVLPKPSRRRALPPRRNPFAFEPLENRLLLSVSLISVPTWIEQGPGPITNGGVTGMPLQNNAVAGAVQAVAVDPTSANNLYIASVNGGVWHTTTATYSEANGIDDDGDAFVDESDEEPTWTPLTDLISSTSMGAIAFSPAAGLRAGEASHGAMTTS